MPFWERHNIPVEADAGVETNKPIHAQKSSTMDYWIREQSIRNLSLAARPSARHAFFAAQSLSDE